MNLVGAVHAGHDQVSVIGIDGIHFREFAVDGTELGILCPAGSAVIVHVNLVVRTDNHGMRCRFGILAHQLEVLDAGEGRRADLGGSRGSAGGLVDGKIVSENTHIEVVAMGNGPNLLDVAGDLDGTEACPAVAI